MATKPNTTIHEAELRVMRRKAQMGEQVAMVGALSRRALSGPVAMGALALAGVWAGRRVGLFGRFHKAATGAAAASAGGAAAVGARGAVATARRKRGLAGALLAFAGPRALRLGLRLAQRLLFSSTRDARPAGSSSLRRR